MIFQLDHMTYSLPPQELRQSAGVKYGTDALESNTVKDLSNPILLWGVVNRELVDGTLFREVSLKSIR